MIRVLSCNNKKHYKLWSELRASLWPKLNPNEHLVDIKKISKLMTYTGWIAFHNDTPIGFVEASLRPFANGCKSLPTVFLEGIWVNPNNRNQGISKKLLDIVEQWAKENQIFEIGSDVDASNKLSQDIHSLWGFKETEKVIYYRKELGE